MKISKPTIADTFENLTPFVRRTPVIDVEVPGVEVPVVLKLELLQHSGSFKARGAFANLLGARVPDVGVAAASGGNHGAAVAYVAGVLDIPAKIFVPEISARAKIERIRSYGAEVMVEGENYGAALANCQAYLDESGAMSAHAYDSPATIVGQGTLAAEFETQVFDGIDTVLMAVGGGGLIGGAAAWYQGSVKLVGVESEGCATLHGALVAGEPVAIKPQGLAADSLGASVIGGLMFPLAQKYVSGVELVSDDDIAKAQQWLWEHLKIITEPGGATAFAAVLSGAYQAGEDERIGVVICGGNTDPALFGKKGVGDD
ncbi:pyridoxal-phosphate dependent enzyme family protein [hydrothermal vent metagenome]|uniref:Pyridoxal-phosphate dependent enzyme family protein n=1 Tax=hydrothermal vent metagenome TaxID=652676 RepID=A0A3B0RSV5_9ZZZZ